MSDQGDELVTATGMATRLAAAQAKVDAERAQLEAAIRDRNELIVEARDEHGWSYLAIARATKLAKSAVTAIFTAA